MLGALTGLKLEWRSPPREAPPPREVALIGNRDKTNGFMLPNKWLDIDVDAGGVVYATDTGRHQVTSWTLDGAPVGKFGRFGMLNAEDFVGCCNPVNLALLPDGGIVFVSSRCNRWVPCYYTQVAILYRCDADGKNIRQLSANTEHDNTPWVLPDGRILYMRWEYVDRSQVHYHHLWTMNPDGTGQTVFFGNLHPGDVYIDAGGGASLSRVKHSSNHVVAVSASSRGNTRKGMLDKLRYCL